MTNLLHNTASAQAQRRPEATAIAGIGESMTYGELELQSNRLAHFLITAGCRRGDRIGLLVAKGPAAVVGILGALKAGAAYVPLDPGDPCVRLARTLECADCRWVLCAGPVGHRLHDALEVAKLKRQPLIGWLDNDTATAAAMPVIFTRNDLEVFIATRPTVAMDANDLAQILFTSGSTGTPKGVMITHSGIHRLIEWSTRYFGVDDSDRIAQQAPLRFDLSTMDIFSTLSTGASLWFVPSEFNVLPNRLGEFVRVNGLTQWLLVPSLLNLMAKFDVVREHDFPALRRILFAGEVLPTPTLMYWMSRLPHVQFTNLYGPTETTICSSYFTIPRCPVDERAAIPIGQACDGEELLILDAALHPVADGETGDLYIAGAGLSPGYWRDPDKTRGAFCTYRNAGHEPKRIYKSGDRARRGADGMYYFCGRSDMQVKSRGYRIELGEIEAALHTLPELRDSAVVAVRSGGFEGSVICCAYASASGAELSPQAVRLSLAALLPNYMLPAHWMQFDVLPKNPNGKLDRYRLRSEFSKFVGTQQNVTSTDPPADWKERRKSPRSIDNERGVTIE